MDLNTMTEKRRKSVRLTKEELKSLKRYRRGFTSASECAETLGMPYQTMDRIILVGSGNPDNIEKIRRAISLEQSQAETVASN